MSKDTAIQFFTAVDKSPELQRQIVPLEAKGESREGDNKLIEIAAKAGYTFSLDDLKAAIKTRNERLMQAGELSEEDLETVAGGLAADWCICTGCCFTKCFNSASF